MQTNLHKNTPSMTSRQSSHIAKWTLKETKITRKLSHHINKSKTTINQTGKNQHSNNLIEMSRLIHQPEELEHRFFDKFYKEYSRQLASFQYWFIHVKTCRRSFRVVIVAKAWKKYGINQYEQYTSQERFVYLFIDQSTHQRKILKLTYLYCYTKRICKICRV